MLIPPHERSLLPFVALQGAVCTLSGFIGYFLMRQRGHEAMFEFTAIMLTFAMLAAALAYGFGARLGLTGKMLMKLGFFVPGVVLLSGNQSVWATSFAFGSFLGLTWSARHWLEMQLLGDGQRDAYASQAGALAVAGGIAATLLSTLLLSQSANSARLLYGFYGMLCLLAAWRLGRGMPEAPMQPLKAPLALVRQPDFVACLPLFFLESGLFGLGQAITSIGASRAMGSAAALGTVATVAGLAGSVGLYLSARMRGIDNRASWLGGSCLAMAVAFLFLAGSAWIPGLFVVHLVAKAAAGPFLGASEHVLNQRALDFAGDLGDRIVVREVTLWALRMVSLLGFWALSTAMPPAVMLAAGAVLMALAVALEYLVAQAWFGEGARQPA
nr:hypothetical protein [uncultured Noviherbaspirillum sp.]